MRPKPAGPPTRSESGLEREEELPLVRRPVEGVDGAHLEDGDPERVEPEAAARALDPWTVAERRRREHRVVATPGDARVEEADEIDRDVAVVDPSLEQADERRAELDVAHEQAAALEIVELDACSRLAVVGVEAVD